MGRLKAMVRSALDNRSPRFILATIALGVAVALLAGFAIGYKVDGTNGGGKAKRGRGEDAQRARARARARRPRLKEGTPFVGTVNTVKGKRLNVTDLDANKKRSLHIGAGTHFYAVETAKASDIKVGSRVLYTPVTGTKATEIVVLPDKARNRFRGDRGEDGLHDLAVALRHDRRHDDGRGRPHDEGRQAEEHRQGRQGVRAIFRGARKAHPGNRRRRVAEGFEVPVGPRRNSESEAASPGHTDSKGRVVPVTCIRSGIAWSGRCCRRCARAASSRSARSAVRRRR